MKTIFYYGVFCIFYNSISTNEKVKRFHRIEVERPDANASIKHASNLPKLNKDEVSMTADDYKVLEQRKKRAKDLTCITCNNVETKACSDPKSKIVKTEKCPDPNDRCLSLHTPFGIVKRSCFNSNRKQLLYFCNCDLCNDIPMNIMHTMQFTVKKDWIENIALMSHARRLSKGVRSRLKCVHCVVKSSNRTDLNGACEIGTYQGIETCPDEEVCGIRVVKDIGAIMRGCVAGPLYNYLYNFCDTDNCNNDPVVSVYDPV